MIMSDLLRNSWKLCLIKYELDIDVFVSLNCLFSFAGYLWKWLAHFLFLKSNGETRRYYSTGCPTSYRIVIGSKLLMTFFWSKLAPVKCFIIDYFFKGNRPTLGTQSQHSLSTKCTTLAPNKKLMVFNHFLKWENKIKIKEDLSLKM